MCYLLTNSPGAVSQDEANIQRETEREPPVVQVEQESESVPTNQDEVQLEQVPDYVLRDFPDESIQTNTVNQNLPQGNDICKKHYFRLDY